VESGAAVSVFNDHRLDEWSLRETPDLVIGAPDEREGYAFGRIAAALVLGDRLVVGDAGFSEVRFYSLSGELITRSGRKGGGPGEYRAIRSLARHGDTAVVVWDVQLVRLTVLSRDGSVQRTITPDLSGAASIRPAFVGLMHTGDIVFRDSRSAWSLRTAPTGERRDSVRYLVVGPAGEWQGRIWAEPGTEEHFMNRNGFWGGTPIIFGRSSFETISAGRLVVGTNDSSVLRQVGADGSIQRVVAFEWTAVPVADGWVEATREHLLDELADTRGTAGPPGLVVDPSTQEKLDRWREEQVRNLPSRGALPAFADVRADAVGRIWIAEYSPPEMSEQNWAVLDSAFEPIARVKMPRTMEILDIGPGFLLSRKTDEMGRESISVTRIIR
jgi:hypothetical protein